MRDKIKKLLIALGLLDLVKNIRRVIKKNVIYRHYSLIKEYSLKYKISYSEARKKTTIFKPNPIEIINSAHINNTGSGDFFYSIDENIIVDAKDTIINNIPVDYSFVISNTFKESKLLFAIDNYIERAGLNKSVIHSPNSLKEALQSILIWNSFLWQTGHRLVGLGRLDKVLDQYTIPDNAEKLISDFLLSLHSNYTFKSSLLKGDTGQIIILGGVEEDGAYFCNKYTYLFIKCLKKLQIPDPKILIRCGKNMPKELLNICVDCMATGIGSPLISNDDVIIPKLIEFGYEKQDAYNYGVSACWEPLSIGNSLEQNNIANIEYGRCIHDTIVDEGFVKCEQFEDVLNLFFTHLESHCVNVKEKLDRYTWEKDPLLSMMLGLEGDIADGFAKYNNYGILSIGISSAVNSLINIKNYAFDKKQFSLSTLQSMIVTDSPDNERFFSRNENGFGTDSKDAINLTNAILNKTDALFEDYRNKLGGRVKYGLSSMTYLDNGEIVGATLDGRRAHRAFPTHISRDKGEPITEIINFESQINFSGISCNANVLDVIVQNSLIKDNVEAFSSYIFGGIKSGLFQLQMNVLSYAQLVDAKKHPERYPNLIVRVWGFSAYFVDLPENYQDNLIRRAKEMEMIV